MKKRIIYVEKPAKNVEEGVENYVGFLHPYFYLSGRSGNVKNLYLRKFFRSKF